MLFGREWAHFLVALEVITVSVVGMDDGVIGSDGISLGVVDGVGVFDGW